MFFGLFQVFYLVKKQDYELELATKQRIYIIFYVSLLESDIIKKKQANKLSDSEREFETRHNEKYEVQVIINCAMYGKDAND